jgi:hypothetical protein
MEPVYLLPDSLRQALLAYLGGQPYAQVSQGVRALEALQPHVPEPAPAPTEAAR